MENNGWCPVYGKFGEKQIGYMHKSRIIKYSDFPKEIKLKVKKQRSGC